MSSVHSQVPAPNNDLVELDSQVRNSPYHMLNNRLRWYLSHTYNKVFLPSRRVLSFVANFYSILVYPEAPSNYTSFYQHTLCPSAKESGLNQKDQKSTGRQRMTTSSPHLLFSIESIIF